MNGRNVRAEKHEADAWERNPYHPAADPSHSVGNQGHAASISHCILTRSHAAFDLAYANRIFEIVPTEPKDLPSMGQDTIKISNLMEGGRDSGDGAIYSLYSAWRRDKGQSRFET